MNKYEHLADYVFKCLNRRLIKQKVEHSKLQFIGKGRTAYVYRIADTSFALKVYISKHSDLAKEEGEIYQILEGISYYPTVHEVGSNYIVMDYIKGLTLYDCLTNGIKVTETSIKEVDQAILLASERGLNPSDIHLRNIILNADHHISLIDLARFRQEKKCRQWSDLKRAFYKLYCKPFFPSQMNSFILNLIRILYKRRFLKIFF